MNSYGGSGVLRRVNLQLTRGSYLLSVVSGAEAAPRPPPDRSMLEFVERIFEASGTLRYLAPGETLIEQVGAV